MKYLLFTLILSISIMKVQAMEQAIPGKKIFIDQLKEMFEGIKISSPWNLDEPLLWGYFFTDSDPEKLKSVVPKLVQKGFTYVDIFEANIDDPSVEKYYFLHIEKAEIHTPKSLDERNNDFYLFANENGLDSYDGMDVGPVNE